MFWIVGGDEVAQGLVQMVGHAARPGSFAEQFEHVEWEGFRFYDLIFPLFLFLVGVVLPFSLRKYMTGDHPKSAALRRTARRVVLLFLLGLIYNGLLRFHFDEPAGHGGLAADRHLLRDRLADLPVHEGPHPGDRVRRDPGGLLGHPDVRAVARNRRSPAISRRRPTWPAISTGIISPARSTELLRLRRQRGTALDDPGGRDGAAGRAGRALAALGPSRWIKALGLACAGLACLGLGMLWGRDFPIIKILWTSSYVLVAGGWSLLLLSLFYTIIDVIKFRAWAFFFVVIGVNAITIYVAKESSPSTRSPRYFLGGVARSFGLVRPGGRADRRLAIEWLFLLHLYRNRIFLRV